MNKSEFVRSMPNATASAVVAAAKGKGMTLSIGQVYNIRSVAKKRAGVGLKNRTDSQPAVASMPRTQPTKQAQSKPSVAKTKIVAALGRSLLDQSFLDLVRRIGTDRAQELLKQ